MAKVKPSDAWNGYTNPTGGHVVPKRGCGYIGNRAWLIKEETLQKSSLGRALIRYANHRIGIPNLTEEMIESVQKPKEWDRLANEIPWDGAYWAAMEQMGLRIEESRSLGMHRLFDEDGNEVGFIVPLNPDCRCADGYEVKKSPHVVWMKIKEDD